MVAKAANSDAGNSATFKRITIAHRTTAPNLTLLNVDT
jgi:hypothetical protein